jgi:hypothetical protein
MSGRPPYDFISLVGDGVFRGVTVVLPTDEVRRLLPDGLVLGTQSLTPNGTHPVLFFFYDMFDARLTVPSLVPPMSYHEQLLGVPFTHVTRGNPCADPGGPFFFMPSLHLDDPMPTIGGIVWWGFPKRLADVEVTDERYRVSEADGTEIVSLDMKVTQKPKPVSAFPHFAAIRAIMDQPIVSLLPFGVGPFLVQSRFEKNWSLTRLAPLSTVLTIGKPFVPKLSIQRHPATGRMDGIDKNPLGSFVIETRWRQTLTYPIGRRAWGWDGWWPGDWWSGRRYAAR